MYLNSIFKFCIAFVLTFLHNESILGNPNVERSFAMAKSANIYARIEPALKEQAEAILNALGIPASNAITMFYRQIILQNGLPFDVKLPEHPLDISRMNEALLHTELEKGYANMQAGQTIPMEQAFADIRKKYGI